MSTTSATHEHAASTGLSWFDTYLQTLPSDKMQMMAAWLRIDPYVVSKMQLVLQYRRVPDSLAEPGNYDMVDDPCTPANELERIIDAHVASQQNQPKARG
jgi:hypothetical protein